MNFGSLDRAIKITRTQRNVAVGLAAVMLATNVMLGIGIYSQSNQTVLVPTTIKDGMVARGAVDTRYLEALALDVVYGVYNASPANIKYGRAVVERIASVKERGELLRHYDEVARDIQERDISTAFYPQRIEHDLGRLEVVVEGDLQTFLNTVMVSTEPRRILLRFVPEAGSVRLAGISRLEVTK